MILQIRCSIYNLSLSMLAYLKTYLFVISADMFPIHIPAANDVFVLTESSYLMWTLLILNCKFFRMLVIKCSVNELGPPIISLSVSKSFSAFLLYALNNRLFFSSSNGPHFTIGPHTMCTSSTFTTTG